MLLFAACGGGEEYTFEEVSEMTELAPTKYGSGLQVCPGCGGLVVIGDSLISAYAEAGDTVIENPGGTVGIEPSSSDSSCHEALQAELDELP
jgi:hypothetical protein